MSEAEREASYARFLDRITVTSLAGIEFQTGVTPDMLLDAWFAPFGMTRENTHCVVEDASGTPLVIARGWLPHDERKLIGLFLGDVRQAALTIANPSEIRVQSSDYQHPGARRFSLRWPNGWAPVREAAGGRRYVGEAEGLRTYVEVDGRGWRFNSSKDAMFDNYEEERGDQVIWRKM